MSRMAIPTMDVVRFKEDDIIVASGPSRLPVSTVFYQLRGFNDHVNDNAKIDNVFAKDLADLYAKGNASGTNVNFLGDDNTTKVPMEKLVEHDFEGKIIDGNYYLIEGVWQKQ